MTPTIYLASASPRRSELLALLGVAFEVVVADVPERVLPGESPQEYALRVAAEKARAAQSLVQARAMPARAVLAADTAVVLDGEILGKPRDRRDGIAMLARLAGRTHDVLTAVVVLDHDEAYSVLSSSKVSLGPLSREEIAAYWETGEPGDKAGGYAIQGRAGAFVRRIEGSYSGVVGLPLYETRELLRKIGRGDGE